MPPLNDGSDVIRTVEISRRALTLRVDPEQQFIDNNQRSIMQIPRMLMLPSILQIVGLNLCKSCVPPPIEFNSIYTFEDEMAIVTPIPGFRAAEFVS